MKKRVFVLITIVISLIIYIVSSYVIVLPQKDSVLVLGIIDGDLSFTHDNVINTVPLVEEGEKQHGDMILSFIEEYNCNVDIAYYDAENNNEISTKSLIEGLNWMIENNIKCVCISLSSDFYSEELETWINEHSDTIKIYASYNNSSNTLDYPAQHSNVIGVGADSKINYKSIDVRCKTNKIILYRQGIHIYKGNSYLAPMTMINDEGGKSVYEES